MSKYGPKWYDWHRWTTIPYWRYRVIRTYNWPRIPSLWKAIWCAITGGEFDRRFNPDYRGPYYLAGSKESLERRPPDAWFKV